MDEANISNSARSLGDPRSEPRMADGEYGRPRIRALLVGVLSDWVKSPLSSLTEHTAMEDITSARIIPR